METIDELKARLATLEKELAKEEEIVEKKEKEINSNPEMIKLVEEQKKLKEKKYVVEKQKEKLEVKIKEQFFVDRHGYSYPNFQHKTSGWSEETNIFDDVLDEIRQHSPLHLLRNGDIEDVVRALIDKAENECSELVELKNRHSALNDKGNELWEKERTLDKELKGDFRSKIYGIRQGISKIKNQIANPDKFIERQKRENKRVEARERLKDPRILDEIYKKLEIEIPKRAANKTKGDKR